MTQVNYHLKLDIDETISLGEDLVSNPPVKHTISGDSGQLDGNSAIPVTTPFSDQVQLSGGTVTLDLAALVRPNLANSNFTGKKVQVWKIKAASGNTEVIIVKPAASNGYHLFGDADGQVTLAAGDQIMGQFNDSLPDVGGSAKDITITSSDVDAIFEIILAAG